MCSVTTDQFGKAPRYSNEAVWSWEEPSGALSVSGTQDKLAEPALLRGAAKRRRSLATAHRVDGADHGFHVPARRGRADREVMADIARAVSEWIESLGS
ncbi:hypothetical protein [Tardiphaga sp.]|jgi:hypothetical protein|uniref:hypothetical protein n=1 Tax=Tardiphaga sp. TaxID=1926292 RepID=UPI0037DA77E8